jgi:hypothetical protein
MPHRPPEYQNLIDRRALEAVTSTPGAVAAYLRNACDYLEAAKALDPGKPLQVFTMAYEGFYALVQAVLEFYQVRTKEAGRNLAIQRVAADLSLSGGNFKLVSDAHARRNGTTYGSPFPPISKAEAQAMAGILQECISVAYTLTGTTPPGTATQASAAPAVPAATPKKP